jgi:hypothetical protein
MVYRKDMTEAELNEQSKLFGLPRAVLFRLMSTEELRCRIGK